MDRRADHYYKKTIPLRVEGKTIGLQVAHSLFSSHAVDAGSRLLLRTLMSEEPPKAILDLGCGYGTLGLGLKAKFPEAEVDLVDRDSLAVTFAARNAALNKMERLHAYASLGYDGIENDRRFDLVVSNLPGKAGIPVLSHLVIGAGRHLRQGGKVAVVVVEPLAGAVTEILESADAAVLRREEAKGYTVVHFTITPDQEPIPSSFNRGVYRRAEGDFSQAGIRWRATTVWGLPEFDSLAFPTSLMIDLVVNANLSEPRTLVINPGQGHVSIAIAASLAPPLISLAGRDLLALRASAANLQSVGTVADRFVHDVDCAGLGADFDLVVAALPDKLPGETTAATASTVARTVAPGGTLVLGGRSTTITRVVDAKVLRGFEPRERSRKHGFSAVRYRRIQAERS